MSDTESGDESEIPLDATVVSQRRDKLPEIGGEAERQSQVEVASATGNRDPGNTSSTKPITVRVDGGGKRAQIAVGTIIDHRFVLEKVLGTGGMSVVYRARDLLKEQARDPNPYGAIKILGTEFSEDPESWIALQREAKKAQSLAHPRIVNVFDFQIDRDSGLPFAYMEELEGESLGDIIRANPKGLKDSRAAADLVIDMAEGLQYAHRRGIVHSDLKPSNVIVTNRDGVKILDFGIARFVPGADSDEFDAGVMNALTPAYASTEMIEGKDPHPSDDLYALGVIAYELFTGQHPYKEVLGDRSPALAARDAGLKVARPPGVSRRQWRALEACLDLDRANRPADGGEFLARFRDRSKAPALLAIAMLPVLALLVWAIWFQEGALSPDRDFDALSIEAQQKFRVAIDSGWEAYEYRDYNGALTYFIKAHDIHLHNPEAEKGLNKIVDDVMDEDLGSEPAEIQKKLDQVSVLLSFDALAERGRLVRFRDELQEKLSGEVSTQ